MDITIGSLTLSLSSQPPGSKHPDYNSVSWNGRSTHIARGRACEFLQVFMESANRILTYEQLISRVYGAATDFDVSHDNIRFHIRVIRRALQEIGAEAEIESIRHEGWRLRVVGGRQETHTFDQKQAVAFRRILDIAGRSRPDLVALLQDS